MRRPSRRARWASARALGLAGLAVVVAIILTAAIGRHKARANAVPVVRVKPLDLTRRPDLLFQVFGSRDEPRMIPIAAIVEGQLTHISLDSAGWKHLDEMYLRQGAAFLVYQDGIVRGEARVTRGMWEQPGSPVYSVERCRALRPQALVQVATAREQGFVVELLASTARMGTPQAAEPIDDARIAQVAKAMATRVGESAEVSELALDSLDFRAVAVPTGVAATPTIVTSWLDSTASSGSRPGARTRHLFVIADRDEQGRYTPTHIHRVNGPLGTAEFRRYLDHLDITGDGVDEIVLEGWRMGGDTWMSVLAFQRGGWREIFRAPTRWCLDDQQAPVE